MLLTLGAALLGALATWLVLMQVGGYGLARPDAAAPSVKSATPGLDIADRLTCRRWQKRVMLVGGAEDGFARGGSEPARIDPRLLGSGYYKDLNEGISRLTVLRNYDEGGVDKYFIDWFEMPRGIESAQLVIRTLGESGSDNDSIRIGDLYEDPTGQTRFGTTEFGGRLADPSQRKALADGSSLQVIDLTKRSASNGGPPQFIDWANSPTRPDRMDVAVGDDTRVDFMALVLCLAPQEARGVTFREFHNDSIGSDLSWLGCTMDRSQSGCDPFSGDLTCKAALPVGCFKGGDRQPDAARLDRLHLSVDSFSGGEVRMSVPIAGDKLPTLAAANKYCQAQFGDGWHVLSYHEGGGAGLVTYSRIAPKSRMWIDIEDQQFANCWDRDKVRTR